MPDLVRYDHARAALQAAHSMDEVKDIRDKAEAMAAYARQAKDLDLIQWATEIKVRAERRCGEMLRESAENGTRATQIRHAQNTASHEGTLPTLSNLDISRNESSRWQKLADMSDDHFEAAVSTAKEIAGEVTTAFMLRQVDHEATGWHPDEQALLTPFELERQRWVIEYGYPTLAHIKTDDRLVRWAQSVGKFLRIDRMSPWGNPFEIPKDGDRDYVIESYNHYYLPRKRSLLQNLSALDGKVLGCWCMPEACHGEVLLETLNRAAWELLDGWLLTKGHRHGD